MLNRIMAASTIGAPEPEVGMGATELCFSDRHAYTIVEVVRFKTGKRAGQVKAVRAQRDKATRTDSHGMSDAQSWTFEPDPEGSVREFRLTSRGRFEGGAGTLAIGYRSEYYDYSF
jgi:hypothetical protein